MNDEWVLQIEQEKIRLMGETLHYLSDMATSVENLGRVAERLSIQFEEFAKAGRTDPPASWPPYDH